MQLSLDLGPSLAASDSNCSSTYIAPTLETTLETAEERLYRLRKDRYDSEDFWEKQELSGAIAEAEVGMEPAVIQRVIERIIFGN